MNALIAYSINENNFVLSPDRTILWEKQNTLILADLHLGRTGHDRRKGTAISPKIYTEDLQRLFSQILYSKADQLIIVGGLSHFNTNKEMELFKKWRNDFSALTIHLVNDNEDPFVEQWYKEMNITRTDHFVLDKFSFRHNPKKINMATTISGAYSFCGLQHPGIPIKEIGKKTAQVPCFYFKNSFALLPAFSRYTVLSKVSPKKTENVFAIVENSLLQVQ